MKKGLKNSLDLIKMKKKKMRVAAVYRLRRDKTNKNKS